MLFAFPLALLPFFQWCDSSLLATSIRGQTLVFPSIEVVHVFGVTVLLGAIVTMDFRLLGFGLRRQSVPQLAKDLSPFMWGGFWVTILTGIPMFASEAMKCYGNLVFAPKMVVLALAILVSLTLHRKATASDEAQVSQWVRKSAAWLSLVLWFGVGVGGRAVGFV